MTTGERRITEDEARSILLDALPTHSEFPLAWVGDCLLENEQSFHFEANIYAEGADPREDFTIWAVDKAGRFPPGMLVGAHNMA